MSKTNVKKASSKTGSKNVVNHKSPNDKSPNHNSPNDSYPNVTHSFPAIPLTIIRAEQLEDELVNRLTIEKSALISVRNRLDEAYSKATSLEREYSTALKKFNATQQELNAYQVYKNKRDFMI